MTDIRVRIGRPTEIVHLKHRAEAEAFVEALRQGGMDVADLEVVENEGRRGVVLVEWILIFVGSGVASSVVSNVTNDRYAAAKGWARRRHQRKSSESESGGSRPVGFLIYGPDGQELHKRSTLDDKCGDPASDDDSQAN